MNERDYLKNTVICDKEKRILELGPLNRPIIKKNEYSNVFYADIRSTEEVKELYSGNDYLNTTGIQVDIDTIENIDFVLKKSYKETFSEAEHFDYIVASHVLEHTTDLIATLQDLATVLKPNGKLCIIYPDKRYCFDHFREEASFRDAFDVFSNGIAASAHMVLDFYFSAIDENSPIKFWYPDKIEELLPNNSFNKAKEHYKEALQGKRMDDVHYWPFSDYGFGKFLYDCLRAELLPYHCVELHATAESTQEFLVILEKKEACIDKSLDELTHMKKLISKIPYNYYNADSGTNNEKNSLWKEKVKKQQEVLERHEVEFQKYRTSVEQQQTALEEYKNVVEQQQKALEEYANAVEQQRIALEEYRQQGEYVKTLENEIQKYQKLLNLK